MTTKVTDLATERLTERSDRELAQSADTKEEVE